jgi:hypothetical protein
MAIPQAAIANALLVAPRTPVMVLDRIVLMLDCHRPVEWRLMHCHLVNATIWLNRAEGYRLALRRNGRLDGA